MAAISWFFVAYAFFGGAWVIVHVGRVIESITIWFFRVTIGADVKRINLLGSPWKPD